MNLRKVVIVVAVTVSSIFTYTPIASAAVTTCPGRPAVTMNWTSAGCTSAVNITSQQSPSCQALSASPSGSLSIPNGTSCTATITCSNSGGPATPQSDTVTYDSSLVWNGSSCAVNSCVPNQGSSCTSSANSCGQTNTGTIQCNGSCSATTPSNSSCSASIPVVTTTGTTALGGTLTAPNTLSAYYGEAATVSWSATNSPTSCTVYRNLGQGVGAVGTYSYPGTTNITTAQVLTAAPYTSDYYVTCTNASGTGTGSTAKFSTPPTPTPTAVSCVNPTHATINWSLPSGYNLSYLRAYKTPPAYTDWASACNPPKVEPNGLCESLNGSSRTMTITADTQYYWYVHTEAANGNWSQEVAGAMYACPSTPPSSPDLTAGNTAVPSSGTANTAVALSSTISNIGTATTGAGFTNLFQSATDASGAGAADIGTSNQATAIVNGGSAPASLSYAFPTEGTFYVRTCADKSSATNTGVITEANANGTGEANNCGEWSGPISVGPCVTNCGTVDPDAALNCTRSPNSLSYAAGDPITFEAGPSGGAGPNFSFRDPGANKLLRPLNASHTWVTSFSDNIPSPGISVAATADNVADISYCGGPFTITGGGGLCGTPVPTLKVTPDRVVTGGTVTLSWSATQVDHSCTIVGDNYGPTVLNAVSCSITGGTSAPITIKAQTQFCIKCDEDKNTQKCVVANILPGFQEF